MKYKAQIKREFSDMADFVFSEINVQSSIVNICYLDTMVNKILISSSIMEPLQKIKTPIDEIKQVQEEISASGSKIVYQLSEAKLQILAGYVAIFLDNSAGILCVPCVGYEKRSIQEPPTSAVLKGPREGFTEDLITNASLIRKRLRTADLKCEEFIVGQYTNSKVQVMYISTVADPKVVKLVKNKIKKINIDGVIDSYYIQNFLQERPASIFKQIGNSEKPDIIVSKLLEGRVAIVVEGSPLVLTVPFVLFEDFQSADDYYNMPVKATMSRLIRVLGVVLAICLPGIYVALESFHYALLPIDFLISLQSSIKALSFPPLIEILFVLFLFEILNEASVRMPKYLGMALSIIGALVLGDTAVKAGIISPPAVIIVAISGITYYTVPDEVATASLLRVFFTVIGGIAGFYGLLIGFMVTITYLMNFNSFGTPYFAPYAPIINADKKDGIFKKSLSEMKERPFSIPNINRVRQRNE